MWNGGSLLFNCCWPKEQKGQSEIASEVNKILLQHSRGCSSSYYSFLSGNCECFRRKWWRTSLFTQFLCISNPSQFISWDQCKWLQDSMSRSWFWSQVFPLLHWRRYCIIACGLGAAHKFLNTRGSVWFVNRSLAQFKCYFSRRVNCNPQVSHVIILLLIKRDVSVSWLWMLPPRMMPLQVWIAYHIN